MEIRSLAVLLLACAPLLAVEARAGNTAKANLALAVSEAHKVQPDAQVWQMFAGEFVSLSGELEPCNPNLPQTGWNYLFWSPTTHADFDVMVCNGKAVTRARGGAVKHELLPPDYLDTDSVGRIVKKVLREHRCDGKSKSWSGPLRIDLSSQKLTWTVTTHCTDDSMLSAVIDAQTGAVLNSAVSEENED